MSYFVYILYSESLSQYYVGQSNNVQKRLARHNAGHGKHTRKGVPWGLVWSKGVESRSEAMQLEKKIKKRGAERFLRAEGIIE